MAIQPRIHSEMRTARTVLAGDPQSQNRYSYVRNMPVVSTDPTGKRGCLPTVSIPESDDGAVWSAHPFWRMRFGLPVQPDCGADCDPFFLSGCECNSDGFCATYGGGGVGCDPETGACLPPTPVLPPPEPSCFARLKWRPMDHIEYLKQNHSFWYAKDPSGIRHFFSAGPSGKLCPVGLCGYLNFESSPSNRETNRDAWPAPGNPCSQVTFMLLDVLVYLQNTFHYGWFGPNCNTIARRLGERAGFTNIQQPPETPGWWYTSLPW